MVNQKSPDKIKFIHFYGSSRHTGSTDELNQREASPLQLSRDLQKLPYLEVDAWPGYGQLEKQVSQGQRSINRGKSLNMFQTRLCSDFDFFQIIHHHHTCENTFGVGFLHRWSPSQKEGMLLIPHPLSHQVLYLAPLQLLLAVMFSNSFKKLFLSLSFFFFTRFLT